MNGKITVIFLTNDTALARSLQDRTKSFVAEFRIVPLSSGDRLTEYAQKFLPDAVLIDDAFLDPMNETLLASIRASILSGVKEERPYFLISAERSMLELKKLISLGFVDVFSKPVDASLFFQKIQIHLPKIKFLKDRLLFSMAVEASIELTIDCQLVSAAEYGAAIRLNRELVVGDIVSLDSRVFGATSGACLGRVIACSPRLGSGEKFEASVIFIAPTKEVLRAIRLWIKHEYLRSRDSGS